MTEDAASRDITKTRFDVIVIGAGVVGCAVARGFSLAGAHVLLVEKAPDILEGASKGNSAILHTGFDAPAGSLEQRCIANGYREYLEIHHQLNLPRVRCGALVLAWNEAEASQLDAVIQLARENGVTDVAQVSRERILAMEPGLAPGIVAGVCVPGESLVDPWSTPLAYLRQAIAHGAGLLRHCEVTSGRFDGDQWRLETSRGRLQGKLVVNCAGLYGDHVHQALGGQPTFSIRPRKGQFVVFDKSSCRLTRSILLPVPSGITKGIVVCPTVFGNLLVGPTAEEQESRVDTRVDEAMLRQLRRYGEQVLPELRGHAVTAVYAGLRPASEKKDYRVIVDRARNYLCLGGIRSTGLSAALGIAQHACSVMQSGSWHAAKPSTVRWPEVPNISEHGTRDWMRPGNDGIVCHCELVSRREILDAMAGPDGATSLAGLKRRTRVTMGRCQGFYCTAGLSAITAGRLAVPLDPGEGRRKR